jgi:hypothetical protein
LQLGLSFTSVRTKPVFLVVNHVFQDAIIEHAIEHFKFVFEIRPQEVFVNQVKSKPKRADVDFRSHELLDVARTQKLFDLAFALVSEGSDVILVIIVASDDQLQKFQKFGLPVLLIQPMIKVFF